MKLVPTNKKAAMSAEHMDHDKHAGHSPNMFKQKTGSHLTKHERNELFILRQKGYSLRAIARTLDRSVSTISGELKRNTVAGTYTPAKAHR